MSHSFTTFAVRFPKWIRYNFCYKHRWRKILSFREALQMLYASNFSNTFSMEKLFNYNPLKLTCWHKVRQVLHPNVSSIITIILCTNIIVNIKHGFSSCCCVLFKFLVELYHLHNFSKCKYQWLTNTRMIMLLSWRRHLLTISMNVSNHLFWDICKRKINIK